MTPEAMEKWPGLLKKALGRQCLEEEIEVAAFAGLRVRVPILRDGVGPEELPKGWTLTTG